MTGIQNSQYDFIALFVAFALIGIATIKRAPNLLPLLIVRSI